MSLTFRSVLLAALLIGASFAGSREAHAFVHIVRDGETLASIAEAVYGRIQYEKLLVAANSLDDQGGTRIVAGMRLEVPAVSYHRTTGKESWAELAERLLGSQHRSDVLAIANGTNPWLPPDAGAEVIVPYNLRLIAGRKDTLMGLTYKYLGDKKQAWVLDRYNALRGRKLRRGDVVLIPLTDLPLTPRGQAEARASAEAAGAEASGQVREVQAKVNAELPALLTDVRGGRYVDAIERGNRLLSAGELTRQQTATIHRHLLTAYAALGAIGLATSSCDRWRASDRSARLDPVLMSPKLIDACQRGRRRGSVSPASAAGSPAPRAPASAGASQATP